LFTVTYYLIITFIMLKKKNGISQIKYILLFNNTIRRLLLECHGDNNCLILYNLIVILLLQQYNVN